MDDIKAFLKEQDCLACGRRPVELHHIKTRKTLDKSKWDNPWNLLPLCHEHHMQWHQGGWSKFLKCYPKVKQYMIDLGWDIGPRLFHSSN